MRGPQRVGREHAFPKVASSDPPLHERTRKYASAAPDAADRFAGSMARGDGRRLTGRVGHVGTSHLQKRPLSAPAGVGSRRRGTKSPPAPPKPKPAWNSGSGDHVDPRKAGYFDPSLGKRDLQTGYFACTCAHAVNTHVSACMHPGGPCFPCMQVN